MANIKEYLDNILSAVFGKDVRQSIHDSIKAMNEEVAESITTSQETKNRQDLLEQKYDEQIENIASSEPQNAEIVDARGGFSTLGSIIKQKVFHFENVETMKNCLTLIQGNVVQTLGYYDKNDGGEGLYEIVNDSSLEDDGGSVHSLSNGLKAKLIIEKDTVNIKQFGAKANLDTFDNANAFINSSKVAKNVLVPSGNYYVGENITLESDTTLEFMENAIATKIPTEESLYRMFDMFRVENVTIKNAKIVGDMSNHLGTSGEYGYPIYIAESENVSILNCDISEAWGDGIYIGLRYMSNPQKTTKNITVDNCYLHNNSRNGLTIGTGNNITIKNTKITDTNRTSPQAGIDIEIENDEAENLYLSNILLENLILENNYLGINLNLNRLSNTANVNNISYRNIMLNNCDYAITYYGGNPTGKWNINNISVDKFNTPFYFVKKGENLETNISNINIYNKNSQLSDEHFNSVFTFTGAEDYSFGNININNVLINNYKYLKRFMSGLRQTSGTTTTINNITIQNVKANNLYNYLLFTNISNINIDNCNFKYLANATQGLSQYFFVNKLLFDDITSYTQCTISNIPDGIYEICLLNRNSTSLLINFNSDLNISGLKTENQITFNKNGSFIKFHKKDNQIVVLDGQNL